MRILVFFDLPVMTKAERKAYTRFRKFLLKDGYYTMLQFSVYTRVCNGEEGAQKHLRRLRQNIPNVNGAIRSLKVTEKQFESMDILLGVQTIDEKLGTNKTDFF
ncbi:CRISPR-associated endonuclease Cas2 [Bacillus cytotoxicus]|uniref:CRISPR-associated endonuclease Cas2 n=1 Tax=Bacillus cytotoxicus TaxID=580165 RepID=UPI0024480CB3|nr:CRISPR-associated endonuclease Cas2 [Bacillus cytotoxicus]MDH2875482.1 CRISPR-associated endonuclease Cas2 [Bacillus cytotoxicus]